MLAPRIVTPDQPRLVNKSIVRTRRPTAQHVRQHHLLLHVAKHAIIA